MVENNAVLQFDTQLSKCLTIVGIKLSSFEITLQEGAWFFDEVNNSR
jgi:hypothetical protein